MDWSIPVIILQLIFLECILSIDNAAVLGAMVVGLPDYLPVVWPKSLKKLGDTLHPILGNQRTAALRVGLLGAYVGRGFMLAVAFLISHNVWIKAIGALYLIRLAFDNLGQAEEGEDDAHVHPVEDSTFWKIVVATNLADLAFSIDNVVAAVSLSNRLWIIMFGVAIGILFMRFAAGWFSYAIEREPILKYAAYILVFNIGVELLITLFTGYEISDWLRFGISISTILLALAYAHWKFLQFFRPVLIWIGQGFANFNEIIDWLLVPVLGLLRLIWKVIRSPFVPKTPAVDPD